MSKYKYTLNWGKPNSRSQCNKKVLINTGTSTQKKGDKIILVSMSALK